MSDSHFSYMISFSVRWFSLLLFLIGLSCFAKEVALTNSSCRVIFNPSTLEVRLQPKGREMILLSAGQEKLGPAEKIEQLGHGVGWILPERKIKVTTVLEGEELTIGFKSEKDGTLKWPVAEPGAAAKAWILPMFEGVYVPSDDARWLAYLTNAGALNTTADLGLPFWGWDFGSFTVSIILTNQFNNEIQFSAPAGLLQATFSHEFTTNNPVKQFGYVIRLGTNSPIAPAQAYRAWLQQRGEFVSLKEKIQKIPATERLLGAAHIYLWGEELITMDDVIDWKGFAHALKEQGSGAKYGTQLKPEAKKFLDEVIAAQWPDRYMKGQVMEDLNRVLALPEFLHHEDEFIAAFPGMLAPKTNWGNGVSPKMVRQLAAAGFDRLWLGAGSWDGFVSRPETVAVAKEKGFLMGPYDSYDSVHRPGAADTWQTAQFDQKLFDTGGIVQANGRVRNGFKQMGHTLSPRAARPYLEKRVDGLMKSFHPNSWFMDCDGFGDFFDDYSPDHPATQQSDAFERVARLKWIATNYNAVIGSEGCSAVIAPAIAFAHGVITPVIGWGDKDLTDKKSKYYLGQYYPPEGPNVFIKTVPIKEVYRYLYYDARFRLPLFETVFHDSVVATHHWSTPSFKFAEVIPTTELLEMLYNVPPLYHLNIAEFQKRKGLIKSEYDFFSPLHRVAGLLPMTEFKWLTEDRMVQKTVFGNELELTANFGTTDYLTVPAQSVLAKWRKTGVTKLFTPKTP